MISKKELSFEKNNLKQTKEVLDFFEKRNIEKQILEKENFDNLMEYYQQEFRHIDDEEKASTIENLNYIQAKIDNLFLLEKRIKKQQYSPYFARMDFLCDNSNESFYIGINNIMNREETYPLVCDWRAPISSMYYDFDLGKSYYNAPMGKIEGEITKKRQFKIREGKIKLCFDTSSTIQDDILQDTLAETSDEKMKNIVATIQKEQNKIVREDKYTNLLVQGVAGSGKTSIALHRVAYLLYQNRQNLSSRDILILSPNHIFSEYISGVLPELGEENLEQTTLDELLKEELHSFVGDIETRNEMLEDILKGNTERQKQISYKASFECHQKFVEFLNNYFNLEFNAFDIKIQDKIITKEEIEDLYRNKYKSKTPAIRIAWIADYIVDQFGFTSNVDGITKRVVKVLYQMFSNMVITDVYHEFLHTIGYHFHYEDKIPYEDLPYLLYIKSYLIGIDIRSEVKYLIIDECQDYTPTMFAVLNQIYPCNKTVLGDIYQAIEKTLNKTYLEKLKVLLDAKLLEMNKCYRSTKQISEYAKNICNIKGFECVERNGKQVEINKYLDTEEEYALISYKFNEWKNYNKIAVITKDEQTAVNLYKHLELDEDLTLITSGTQQQSKYMIIPASMSKGLEFDAVIVYKVKEHTKLDKKIKFISATRALHELVIIE